MGGELFNSGAVEISKLAELTGLRGPEVVSRSAGLNLLACSAALCAFWLQSAWRRRRSTAVDRPVDELAADAPAGGGFRVSPVKAMVPLVPLLILSVEPLLGPVAPFRSIAGPPRILAAMLIGIVAAGMTSVETAGRLAPVFFEGAGYAYQHVISLIVAASTFAEALRLSGLVELVIQALVPWPVIAMGVGIAAPWLLAVVAGTGIAPAVAVMEFFVPAATSIGLAPVHLGTLAALGAHFGRTMSPAAAVVMVSARLSEAKPTDLVRQVTCPLLVGGAVLLGAAVILRSL
jgi:DcuC family C4-dicarboxylate transporter